MQREGRYLVTCAPQSRLWWGGVVSSGVEFRLSLFGSTVVLFVVSFVVVVFWPRYVAFISERLLLEHESNAQKRSSVTKMASRRRDVGKPEGLRLDFPIRLHGYVHMRADPTWNLQRTNKATLTARGRIYWYRSYWVSRIQYYIGSIRGAVVTTFERASSTSECQCQLVANLCTS